MATSDILDDSPWTQEWIAGGRLKWKVLNETRFTQINLSPPPRKKSKGILIILVSTAHRAHRMTQGCPGWKQCLLSSDQLEM